MVGVAGACGYLANTNSYFVVCYPNARDGWRTVGGRLAHIAANNYSGNANAFLHTCPHSDTLDHSTAHAHTRYRHSNSPAHQYTFFAVCHNEQPARVC